LKRAYWKPLEWVINATFMPIQGPGHCYRAWQIELDEIDTRGSYISRLILGLFALAGCLIIAPILWLTVLIIPAWRYKPGQQQYDAWRQARQASISRRDE